MWWAAAFLALFFHAFWEGHGLFDPAFRNPDVAGIVYNARLFGAGRLPYLDSAEIKPPGAFLLFAPLLDLGGMRAVWGAAIVWGAALSLATGLLAASVWNPRAGPRATVLHAACAAVASDADINYSFWMATPFTLAAACACAAAGGAERRQRWLFAASGFLALFAVSIKPSAWPLLAVFAVLIGREALGRRFRSAFAASLAGAGGALVAAALLCLPFLARGELGSLASGLGTVNAFGQEYVNSVASHTGGRLRAMLAGAPCVAEQMPGLLLLALLGVAELFPHPSRAGRLPIAAWTFALAAFLGIAFTLRFFSHDNAQLWPALAVIALRPAGLLGRALDATDRIPFVSLALTGTLGLAAAWPGFEYRWGYVHWMAERDHMIEDICTELAPRLPPNEPVLAWGWNAWSVYEHCQRRAPGRVFKVIASVTTVNTNTCNNGFGPMRLREGPEPARFLDEVKQRPPALFLWSNYFKEMGSDPLDDWAAFRVFLDARYDIVDVRGPFVAFLRSDLTPQRSARSAPEFQPESAPPAGSGLYGWSGRAGSVWTSTSLTPENPPLIASITQCVTR
jgi:hypothetical protein